MGRSQTASMSSTVSRAKSSSDQGKGRSHVAADTAVVERHVAEPLTEVRQLVGVPVLGEPTAARDPHYVGPPPTCS